VAQSHQANRAADRVHDELAPYRSRNCSMEHQGDEPDHNMCFSPLWILLFSGEHVKAAPCCIWSFVRITDSRDPVLEQFPSMAVTDVGLDLLNSHNHAAVSVS
jgi:hypothetical protein